MPQVCEHRFNIQWDLVKNVYLLRKLTFWVNTLIRIYTCIILLPRWEFWGGCFITDTNKPERIQLEAARIACRLYCTSIILYCSDEAVSWTWYLTTGNKLLLSFKTQRNIAQPCPQKLSRTVGENLLFSDRFVLCLSPLSVSILNYYLFCCILTDDRECFCDLCPWQQQRKMALWLSDKHYLACHHQCLLFTLENACTICTLLFSYCRTVQLFRL